MKLSNKFGFQSIFRKAWGTSVRAGRAEGSALYEFAMVLPVLSMFLVGIVYGGITFYDYVTLADAVAVGARTLATNRLAGASSSTNQNACQLANAALTNAATNLKSASIAVASVTFTGSGGSTCNALAPGDYGTVSATYPCALYFPNLGINICPVQGSSATGAACPQAPYCITSTTTVRIE
jgi:Flp pilus assembly protein TadG